MHIDDLPLNRRSAAWGLAAALAILFNTLLTVAKELSASLKVFMAMLTGHHWTAHALWVLVVFALLGVLFNRMQIAGSILPTRLVILVISTTVVAGLGLLSVFVWLSL